MASKGKDFAASGITVKPSVAAAAPHRIPVSTLRRSISIIGCSESSISSTFAAPFMSCTWYRVPWRSRLPAHERMVQGFVDFTRPFPQAA
jgi:hypothetical protein